MCHVYSYISQLAPSTDHNTAFPEKKVVKSLKSMKSQEIDEITRNHSDFSEITVISKSRTRFWEVADPPVHTWFLEITLMWTSVCVCVCVSVCPPPHAIRN